MGIFNTAKNFTNKFFDKLSKNMENKLLKETEKKGAESRSLEKETHKKRQQKRNEEELGEILDSIPEARSGPKSTNDIMQIFLNYIESNGRTTAPTINDFMDLNNNEDLNIRIQEFDAEGRALITDYRNALLKSEIENINKPKNIELIINNYVEPDNDEKSNNAKGNRNLEQAAEYIQNNFKSLSEYFLPTAKFAVINQSIDTSFIQKTFKIGYFKASEVIEQLESAGMITEIPENSEYSALLNGQEELDAILLLLREDIQNKLKEQFKKC